MSDRLQSRDEIHGATSTNAGQKAMLSLQLEIAIARFSSPAISLFRETLTRDHMPHFLHGNLMAGVTFRTGAFGPGKMLAVFQVTKRLIIIPQDPVRISSGIRFISL
ncbi:hypothetical protein NU219Hw_g2036t1 [Hortaea werneckii]